MSSTRASFDETYYEKRMSGIKGRLQRVNFSECIDRIRVKKAAKPNIGVISECKNLRSANSTIESAECQPGLDSIAFVFWENSSNS